jgi:dTDP-4-dehydrorhamnose 3,5-epimerase-like enzyme
MGIDWHVAEGAAVLSERDRKHPALADVTDLF